MKYRAILLDHDGTLADFAACERCAIQRILMQLKIDDAQAPARFRAFNEHCWKEYEMGLITQDQIKVLRFQRLFEFYGLAADPADISRKYENELAQQSILLPGALNAVQQISSHLPVAILTNGISIVQRERIKRAGLMPYLSGLFISSEVGAPKPLPDMYRMALHALGEIAPCAALMIGDSLSSDILGALRMGIPACWYNPNHLPKPDGWAIQYDIDCIDQMISIALS